MAYEGDEMASYQADMPENRRKRTAQGLHQATHIGKTPSQMNPSDTMKGFDPLIQSLNGSNDPMKEMVDSLKQGKQNLFDKDPYDYGPERQSGEFN